MAFGLLLFSSFTGVFADSDWRLTINGAVSNTLNLTLDDLAAMPKTTVNAILACYGQFVVSGDWTGVRLGLLLEQAGYNQGAESVDFYAQDGYQTNLPIETAMRQDVIVAYEKDGQPLTETLRLVIPGANGNLWIALITSISVSMSPSPPSPIAPEPIPTPTPTQPPTPPPPPKSQPKNETATQPITPPTPTNSQPVQQQGSSGSNFPAEYGYPIVFAAIAAIAAAAVYLIHERKK
jgi:DMSO/TMAO reductase YedYZ molybdopterin-dependent catalytic subunit